MKIFLSWSGELSRKVAEIIRKYLPCMIQESEVFMSQHDLESGARWSDQLAGELDKTHFGIICLTSENLTKPWILFEAGALTKHLEGRACSLLLDGLSPAMVSGPLSQFQNRIFNKVGFKALIHDLNKKLPDPIIDQQLSMIFEKWWPDIEKEYESAISITPSSNGEAVRSQQEIVEELLLIVRGIDRRIGRGFDTPPLDLMREHSIPDNNITINIEEPLHPDKIVLPFDPNFLVKELLNVIYNKMYPLIEPYTFGVKWSLKNDETGLRLRDLESIYKNRDSEEFNELTFEQIGFLPGMVLRTLLLQL